MRSFALATASLAIGLTAAQDLATALGGQESLSSLVSLLEQYPDVTQFLASQDGITLFAPNNEAIAAIDEETAADTELVAQILTYHAYQGVVASSDIRDVPQFVPSFLEDGNISGGQVAAVSLADGSAIVTSGEKAVSTVTKADIEFDGGIIHIIDSVLTIPGSVSETLLAGGLTALAGAATQLDLVSTLEGLGDATIFAPNNDAFAAIADAAAGLSTAQLASILQYHVISGTVVYSTLLSNASVPTLGGTFVDITVGADGAVFIDGARVINSDILVANGVIHVIDGVLNPDATDVAPGTPGFPTGNSDTVPFTSGLNAPTSTVPELAATNSLVAAVLVTASPEPTIYLLPNLSLSTDLAGNAPPTPAAGSSAQTTTVSSGAAGASATPSSAAQASGASSSVASGSMTTSASSSEVATSASEEPAQQTTNAGARNLIMGLAAFGGLVLAAAL